MINIQRDLRPALPTVYGPKDYREFRATLEEMDRILDVTGIENRFIMRMLSADTKERSATTLEKKHKICRAALRYSILLTVTGKTYRGLVLAVAGSQLFQWFTGTARVDGIHPLSKSTIERLEKLIPSNELGELIHDLNGAAV